VNLLEKLKKFEKISEDIHALLELRNKFVEICAKELNYDPKDLVWSDIIAPSLILSLILSEDFEKSEKKRIFANSLIDLCHLFFALKDRIKDQQISEKKEIEKYERTSKVFRCTFQRILNAASSDNLINKKLLDFFKNFFDNLIRYAKKKVYKKDDEIKISNLYTNLKEVKKSNFFTISEILEVHKTKFGNFFRGMGYFLFKFYGLNLSNNRAYFDLFFNIGMLAQLVDDLRDFFWQDIDIEQPNIVLAILIHECWETDGEKFRKLLKNRNNSDNKIVKELDEQLNKMRLGKISVFEFYHQNFPLIHQFIEILVQKYRNNIDNCLKELNINKITTDEIIEIYGVIIPLVKKWSS